MVSVRRIDGCLAALDPMLGAEIKKTRPCVIVSPDEMNAHVPHVIAAPRTTHGRAYPTRIACRFQGKRGFVVLAQIRTVDRIRLVKRLGRLGEATAGEVLRVLQEMFAP